MEPYHEASWDLATSEINPESPLQSAKYQLLNTLVYQVLSQEICFQPNGKEKLGFRKVVIWMTKRWNCGWIPIFLTPHLYSNCDAV